MAKKRAGWERMLYEGAPGSAAATLVDTAEDIDLGNANEFNETTTRGDGTSVPKKTEQTVALTAEPSFKFVYKDSDTAQANIIAAAQTGAARAIKIVDFSGGSTEFDGDCYIERTTTGPLKGGHMQEFTCHPTDDNGRDWSFT